MRGEYWDYNRQPLADVVDKSGNRTMIFDFVRRSAKSQELQVAMSLSRLWQKQGRKEESRQLLAEIYNWFTEGV